MMDKISESYSGDVRRVVSVSDFTRRASSYLQKLDGTRSPLVLTVNGRAAAVVQDAETYQEMVDLIKLFSRAHRSENSGAKKDAALIDEVNQFVLEAGKRNLAIDPKISKD